MIFLGGEFDYNELAKNLFELKQKTDDPDIWSNSEAKFLFKKIKNIEKKIADFNRIELSLSDLKEFYRFAKSENDDKLIEQLDKGLCKDS